MPSLTLYCKNTTLSPFQEMSETSPGAEANSSPAMGWVVGTGSTLTAAMAAGTKVPVANFVDTTHPDGVLDTTNGDGFRSLNTYTGSFASELWTWSGAFIGLTQAGTQDGFCRVRLFRSTNANGSGATEITAGAQTGSTVTNLSAATQQASGISFNPGAFSLSNEYLFLQVAWTRTGAGGMSTTDVIFRYGTFGCRLATATFTASATAYTADLAETITLSESVDIVRAAPIALAETVTISESIGVVRAAIAELAESIAIAEGATGTVERYPTTESKVQTAMGAALGTFTTGAGWLFNNSDRVTFGGGNLTRSGTSYVDGPYAGVIVDGAIAFSGSTDSAYHTTLTYTLNASGDLVGAVAFKTSTIAAGRASIMSASSDGSAGWMLRRDGSDLVFGWTVGESGGNFANSATAAGLVADTWYLAIFVCDQNDGGNGDRTSRVGYVNLATGAVVVSSAQVGNGTSGVGSVGYFSFGADYGGFGTNPAIGIAISGGFITSQAGASGTLHTTGMESALTSFRAVLAGLAAYVEGLNETVTIGEAIAVVVARTVGLAETLTLSESVAALRSSVIGLAETVSLVESIASARAAIVAVGETVSIVEAVVVAKAVDIGLAESLALAESVSASRGAVVALDEAVTLAEALTVQRASTVSLAEGVGISEAVAAAAAFAVALGETVTISEAVAIVASFVASIGESVAISEALVAAVAFGVGLAEALTITEGASELYDPGGGATAYSADLAETLTIVEAISVRVDFAVGLAESLAVSESVGVSRGTSANVAESITLAESLGVRLEAIAAVVESFSIAESIGARADLSVGLAESVAFVEAMSAAVAVTIALGEAVSLAELALASYGAAVEIAEVLTLAEAVGAGAAFTVALIEVVTIVEIVSALGLSDLIAVLAGSPSRIVATAPTASIRAAGYSSSIVAPPSYARIVTDDDD